MRGELRNNALLTLGRSRPRICSQMGISDSLSQCPPHPSPHTVPKPNDPASGTHDPSATEHRVVADRCCSYPSPSVPRWRSEGRTLPCHGDYHLPRERDKVKPGRNPLCVPRVRYLPPCRCQVSGASCTSAVFPWEPEGRTSFRFAL